MATPEKRGKPSAAPKPTSGETGNFATRTMPSVDVAEIRKQYEQLMSTRRHPRVGTVQLGPEMLREETDARVPVRPVRLPLESESGEGATVDRDKVLKSAQPVRESTPTPTGGRSSLDLLIAALEQERLSDEPPPYLPARIGERFDGMMRGGTLELKVDPPWGSTSEEGTPQEGVSEIELGWLGDGNGSRQALPNSYGLPDEDVSRAFAAVLPGLRGLEGEKLLAVGRIARIEGRLVDRMAVMGRLYRQLVTQCARQGNGVLREHAGKLGLLDDADLKQVLRRWVENAHPPEFFADDDSRRLKQVRLVGVYLVRKKGEALCRFQNPRSRTPRTLLAMKREVEAIKRGLEERSRIIQRYFDGRKEPFATSFLVQRGPNARPGFFWSDETCLD